MDYTPIRPDLDQVIERGLLTKVDASAPTRTERNLKKRHQQRRHRPSQAEKKERDRKRIPLPANQEAER